MACRLCGSDHLKSLVDLGITPLANGLLKTPYCDEPTYPLEVMVCQNCYLAQLKDIIDPKMLFTDYVYFSSNSDEMIESCRNLTESLCSSLPKDAIVVEIASNDGYLLQHYVKKDIKVLGIDPAKNIAEVANSKGVPTHCAFFSKEYALKLLQDGIQADLIHANNVMAHVPDIHGFVQGLKTILKPKGRIVIEIPYLIDLIEKCAFDTIYHEHVYYFALKPLIRLCEQYDLDLYDVKRLTIHGGSLRLFIAHKGDYEVTNSVEILLSEEHRLLTLEYLQNFSTRIRNLKDELFNALQDIKSKGYKIAAYGASAKGATLLNFFEIGKDLIDFVVDRSPVKQGLFTPGTHLPILPPSALITEQADYALLLTWNFAKEILQQQSSFIEQGGQFILPIPEVRIAA